MHVDTLFGPREVDKVIDVSPDAALVFAFKLQACLFLPMQTRCISRPELVRVRADRASVTFTEGESNTIIITSSSVTVRPRFAQICRSKKAPKIHHYIIHHIRAAAILKV